MVKTNFKLVSVGALALSMASSAFCVSWSSFASWDSLTGVSVASSNSGLDNVVSLDPGATMVINSTSYSILNIFGFYSLTGTGSGDLSATGGNIGIWSWDGGSSVAGWSEN